MLKADWAAVVFTLKKRPPLLGFPLIAPPLNEPPPRPRPRWALPCPLPFSAVRLLLIISSSETSKEAIGIEGKAISLQIK